MRYASRGVWHSTMGLRIVGLLLGTQATARCPGDEWARKVVAIEQQRGDPSGSAGGEAGGGALSVVLDGPPMAGLTKPSVPAAARVGEKGDRGVEMGGERQAPLHVAGADLRARGDPETPGRRRRIKAAAHSADTGADTGSTRLLSSSPVNHQLLLSLAYSKGVSIGVPLARTFSRNRRRFHQ